MTHKEPQAELPKRLYRAQLPERRGGHLFWVRAVSLQAAADKVAKILDNPYSYAFPTNREQTEWQVHYRKEGDNWGKHIYFRLTEVQPKPKDGDQK